MKVASTLNLAAILLQNDGDTLSIIFSVGFLLVSLLITVVTLAGIWKIFVKAGHPGWTSLVPLYNVILWLQMIGRPWWYLAALFFPGVNAILWLIIAFGTARSFGRGILFALGVTFLPFIFIPIIGFGQAAYIGGMGPSYRRGPKIA
jgi:hypothetical protein